MRFLVVDDFDTMIKITKNVLDDLGYQDIITARNGEQAYQILTKEKIDFIISDWNMPVMTGIELLKKVRGNPKLAHIPFLMVTAESEKDHIVEAIQAKVDQYILKPFNQEMLAQKIGFILHNKKEKA
ncbi:MAG: response regulator [Proteobacteria bacterium]|nr:response regulator [Pseudomonadota bacterium]MBU0965268.1 response regulator [Pseudomonadota bacterium]